MHVEVRLLNVQIPIASGNMRCFVSQETIDAYCRAQGEDALGTAKKKLQVAGLAFPEHILTGHAGQTIRVRMSGRPEVGVKSGLHQYRRCRLCYR